MATFTKLSWKANNQKPCQNASETFYFHNRNVSVLANIRTKFNAYSGYAIPVLSYASMVWFRNKTECKKCIQKKAKSWIFNSMEVNQNKRLTELKLLSLSYYSELHDILTLITLLQRINKIELPITLNQNLMNTWSRGAHGNPWKSHNDRWEFLGWDPTNY